METTKKDQKITDIVKTIDDVIKLANPTEEELAIANYSGTNARMIGAKYALLRFMICDVLNEGWEANWKDYDQKKWFSVHDMDSTSGVGFSLSGYDGWAASSSVGSRLCLKSRELSDYAAITFPEVFKGFLTK